MRKKEEILTSKRDQGLILEVMIDIRDTLVEIEQRLTEIGGQVEDIGGEARMNMQLHNR